MDPNDPRNPRSGHPGYPTGYPNSEQDSSQSNQPPDFQGRAYEGHPAFSHPAAPLYSYSTGAASNPAYPYQNPHASSYLVGASGQYTGAPEQSPYVASYQPPPPPHPPRRAAEQNPRSDGPQYHFFQDGEGILREVIQTDIQRYLGRDSFCTPGTHEGVEGYFIGGSDRTFTSAQVEDLQADSEKWAKEKRRNPNAKYRESRIHESRRYWGPRDQRPSEGEPAPPQDESSSYTHFSGAQPLGYGTPGVMTPQNPGPDPYRPRTMPAGPPITYEPSYSSATASGSQQASRAQNPTYRTATHYLASDNKWYPITEE